MEITIDLRENPEMLTLDIINWFIGIILHAHTVKSLTGLLFKVSKKFPVDTEVEFPEAAKRMLSNPSPLELVHART
jgi:hypothetical protein